MNVSDFDFDLPPALVAQDPPAERGASRLLALDRATGRTSHHAFADLPNLLKAGDVLVVNDTRVFPARLIGTRLPGGGAAECFLISRVAVGFKPMAAHKGPPYVESPSEDRPSEETWTALVHPGQRLREGSAMVFEPRAGAEAPALHAEVVGRHFHGRRTVRLWTSDGSPVRDAIDAIGHIPLPPYIKRDDRVSDRERYQTVYARARGSIAAPTAGLHFTPALFEALASRGVSRVSVTLHVGYGTFQPVRVARVEEHNVEAEHYEVSAEAARVLSEARREGRRIIAVGTTTTRTLESLTVSSSGEVQPGTADTSLFIHPGHEFRLVSGLVTNFHLPQSSLLMLVCAFGGTQAVLAAYKEAVTNGYRFYSYGDAMFVV
jgi:S-adenosylmethionine:tRNA ribosyltransferase-isomerase